MKPDGRLVADPGEMEIARGIEDRGLEFELLFAGPQDGKQIGFAVGKPASFDQAVAPLLQG